MFVNGLPNADLLGKVGVTWQQVYRSGLSAFLKVQPTDWSRPSFWLAAWGKSDSLAKLAAKPTHRNTTVSGSMEPFLEGEILPVLTRFRLSSFREKNTCGGAAEPVDPGFDMPPVQGGGNTGSRTGGMPLSQSNDSGSYKSVGTSARQRKTI